MRVRLLHWNAAQASVVLDLLHQAEFTVDYDETFDSSLMRKWRESPPVAFVIDLSRLPAQGREIAIALRQSPKTRQVPIVFCNGLAEKVESTRTLLPDATYCKLDNLVQTLRQVQPALAQVQPAAMMNRYGARTAAQKLGVKEGSTVALFDPPRNLETLLGNMPPGVEFVEQEAAVTLCFVHSADSLRADMHRLRNLAASTKLWFLWRKKAAPVNDGITEPLVRETGIQLGLVDYKICSVDHTWSAMAFARKK